MGFNSGFKGLIIHIYSLLVFKKAGNNRNICGCFLCCFPKGKDGFIDTDISLGLMHSGFLDFQSDTQFCSHD